MGGARVVQRDETMDSNRDHKILEAYLRRPNRRRLARVVRAFHQYVRGVALKVAGNREDAADVCQEFFLSLSTRRFPGTRKC